MSNIPVKNPLTKMSMNDFRSWNSVYGGPAKSCRFAVRIMPARYHYTMGYGDFLKQFVYLCEAAEMPGRGFVNADVRYYGPNQKLPVKTQYEDTTLTFICRSESYERQFFDDWMESINPTNSFDFNYRKDYETTVEIMQFAEYGVQPQIGPNLGTASSSTARYPKETYRITLFNAFPLLINPQPMTWADDQMQRLAVTFTYHKWKRVGYDRPSTINETHTLVAGRQNITNGTTLT